MSKRTGRRKKEEKEEGGLKLRKNNNGVRGNEATVVRDWHMRQCGREGEEMGGVAMKAA